MSDAQRIGVDKQEDVSLDGYIDEVQLILAQAEPKVLTNPHYGPLSTNPLDRFHHYDTLW